MVQEVERKIVRSGAKRCCGGSSPGGKPRQYAGRISKWPAKDETKGNGDNTTQIVLTRVWI